MKLPVYPLEILPEISRAMQKENMNYSRLFVRLPQENVDKLNYRLEPSSIPVHSAFRNKFFLVQIYIHNENLIRLSINRTELDHKGYWKDGILWDEIQHIKNTLGYEEFDAIEVYPKKSDLVDVSNIRHIWILKNHDLDFIWRKDK